jgi:hypothetical protein
MYVCSHKPSLCSLRLFIDNLLESHDFRLCCYSPGVFISAANLVKRKISLTRSARFIRHGVVSFGCAGLPISRVKIEVKCSAARTGSGEPPRKGPSAFSRASEKGLEGPYIRQKMDRRWKTGLSPVVEIERAGATVSLSKC